MFVAKAEAANAQWQVLMTIIAHLSDEKLSSNSVEMTQKSCFLVVAQPGFGPGSGASFLIWSRLSAVNRDYFGATETASHCS